MTKSTKKRTVTCGKCQKTGHNARTCSTKLTTTSVQDIPATLVTEAKLQIDAPTQRRVPRREAPTKDFGASAAAAPYRCKKCNNVAILVAVKVKDHNASFIQKKDIFVSDLRCELCMNKPSPSDLILKWGAAPDEVVPIPGQDA